jgi:hypothetical protein
MNSNIKIFLFCPVPENQKPINDFLLLQENSTFNNFSFSKKIFLNLGLFFLISFGFFSYFSFSNLVINFFKFQFVCFLFLFIFFFLLFFKWSLLENRLNEARLIYEEGSWYDSQIWEKPFLLIKNDRLITTQRIQPIIQRVSKNLIFIFFITFLLFLI